jgi:hypothetical protein
LRRGAQRPYGTGFASADARTINGSRRAFD